MTPPKFDNFVNKVKEGIKQAADKIGRETKVVKLKMDVMALSGEKSRHFQTIGEKAYGMFSQNKNLDGPQLTQEVQEEFTQIDRIDNRIREIEREISDLHAAHQCDPNCTDATEVHEVSENH